MKKILIVDDNENNRMLLRALLEDYAHDSGETLNIDEAVNGSEACMMAEGEHYSLILMDIMMPEMDGIEATRRIRAYDAKTMIVAVSAVDDGERQRQILRNGAEDYISKPIHADVFTTRLGSYFSLIDSRTGAHRQFNPSPTNLFTQETYSRKLLFYVQNDDELAEFWEYYLLDSAERCEHLSDAVRTIYALASVGLKVGARFQITTEESVDKIYITLTGIETIDPKIIKLVLMKNPAVTDYKMDNVKFSVRLPRLEKTEPLVIVTEKKTADIVKEVSAAAQTSATYSAVQEKIQVYDYMDQEDLIDLQEYVGKLNSLMLIVGGEIEQHEVEEISANLQQISKIATGYTDSYPIGQALAGMGHAIMAHSELFMAKAYDLAPMCAAFGRDLSSWIRLIFVEGAVSVNYMDDTIIANAQMIESILTMDDADHGSAAENLDDIFDF